MADDRFEDSLRALARQISQSLSSTDLDEVAERFGVDRERLQGAAGAVEGWLDRASSNPLFSDRPGPQQNDAPFVDDPRVVAPSGSGSGAGAGPHPLDLPTDEQGRALSALASGRWTLRPGSGALSAAEPVAPAPPANPDLTGDLRARDWITSDGSVTLVGRQALRRWCETAEGEADRPDAD